MQIVVRCSLALLLSFAMGCGKPAATTDPEWLQWRGPSGTGVSSDTALPVAWSAESENVRWRAVLESSGNSSPVVAHGQVYFTGAARAKRAERIHRSITAFDLATGERAWAQVVFSGPAEKVHRLSSHAIPTPAADADAVYVYLGPYLARFDPAGNEIWKKEIDPDYLELSRYGTSSSPVLAGNAVLVFRDDEWGREGVISWLAAFDKATGDELWRHESDDTCCSYATPLLVERGGAPELLLSTSKSLVAYRPSTGERLWAIEYPMVQVVPSPVIDGDLLAVTGGVHEKGIHVYRLTGHGSATRAEHLWGTHRGVPEIASPVLYMDHLYVVTEKGVLTCFDAASGEQRWKKRVPGQDYHGSLAAGDGKIYVTNSLGVTTVVAASPEYQRLAENDLGGGSGASIAIAGGSLLLRTQDSLYRIDAPTGKAG